MNIYILIFSSDSKSKSRPNQQHVRFRITSHLRNRHRIPQILQRRSVPKRVRNIVISIKRSHRVLRLHASFDTWYPKKSNTRTECSRWSMCDHVCAAGLIIHAMTQSYYPHLLFRESNPMADQSSILHYTEGVKIWHISQFLCSKLCF